VQETLLGYNIQQILASKETCSINRGETPPKIVLLNNIEVVERDKAGVAESSFRILQKCETDFLITSNA